MLRIAGESPESAWPGQRGGKGYSLPELMVVLLVAIILLALGMPALGGMLRKQQMSAAVRDFYAAIQLTRSEAIRRGTRVDLLPSDNEWTRGWVVLVDRNRNRRADDGEEIIFTHGPVPPDMMIHDGFGDTGKPYLAYNGSGYSRSDGSNLAPRPGSWTFVLGNEVRRIIVNFTGRPRICNPQTDASAC